MATSRSSIFLMLVTAGSKIPIFTGRPTDLKPWLMALMKKQRVHDLTDAELINLAYDYSDGIVSEWIGSYLDDHPDTSSKTLFDEITAQYGEFINPADAARALIKVTQEKNESLAELASRMSSLARMAYRDSELREGSAVQVQLAEFFIDGINNSFIREDVARANPKTLSEALSSARESERLYERLRGCREKEKNNKFSGRNYWRQERIGSSTVLREPKAEGYYRKWAGESHGCYSCRQPVHKKKGNAPSQQERWNCDEQMCPRSEGGNITYSTSEKRKTKKPAQTKSHKTNHIHSLRKEKNKVTLAPKIKTNSKDSCSTREMVNSPNKKRAEEYELFTQGSDMMCRVDIMGKQVKALIDSGSEVSLLKSSIFEGLKNSKMKLKGSDLTVTQANGQKMRLNGMIHINIKIGKIETGSTLYIAPDLDQTMILGEDWLKINKAQLCFNPNRLTIKGVEIPLDSKTSGETKIYTVDSVKLPPRTAISCAAKVIPSEPNEENLYQVISKEASGMHVNMEEEEKQRMEDFVRDLFSKTDDFNLLTKKIVGKKYLQHSQKDSLNPQQKSIFADIIVKLLFEFNVGNEESVKANGNKIITPPSAQEKSGVPEDGNSNSPSELSKSAQETQPQTLLSRTGSCPKVENETSLDACTTEVIELEEKEDVEAVEKKLELSKNAKKSTMEDVKDKQWSLLSLRPSKRILSRQILINDFQDKVKKTSPYKFPSPFASATIPKHPLTNSFQKLTNEKSIHEESQGKTTSFADQPTEKKQKAVTKRLSAFEVLQSVLEDSNDGSLLSKRDLTDDDRASAPRSSPVGENLPDKEDSLIPLEEISDSTPTRRRLASEKLLESDSESMGGFTPPTKIKKSN